MIYPTFIQNFVKNWVLRKIYGFPKQIFLSKWPTKHYEQDPRMGFHIYFIFLKLVISTEFCLIITHYNQVNPGSEYLIRVRAENWSIQCLNFRINCRKPFTATQYVGLFWSGMKEHTCCFGSRSIPVLIIKKFSRPRRSIGKIPIERSLNSYRNDLNQSKPAQWYQ